MAKKQIPFSWREQKATRIPWCKDIFCGETKQMLQKIFLRKLGDSFLHKKRNLQRRPTLEWSLCQWVWYAKMFCMTKNAKSLTSFWVQMFNISSSCLAGLNGTNLVTLPSCPTNCAYFYASQALCCITTLAYSFSPGTQVFHCTI